MRWEKWFEEWYEACSKFRSGWLDGMDDEELMELVRVQRALLKAIPRRRLDEAASD